MAEKLSSGVTSLQYVNTSKKQQARELRKHATPAESLLWEALRNRKTGGLKFRRQQVIEGFITDFYCEAAKLAVEIDGGVHSEPEQREIDLHREKVFKSRGIRTVRLKNEMIMHNLRAVLDRIIAIANAGA